MVSIIKCLNCNQSNIPFGEESINVTYTKKTIKCCESCNNTKSEVNNEFFCSKKCFREYLKVLLAEELKYVKESIKNLVTEELKK